MSLKSPEISCARCRSYLFKEDDVVYCPICGAPHHRECYNALGHCALEELHGTENEYSRKAVEVKEEKKEEKYESKSVRPEFNPMGGFAEFDFLGGVPADYDLGDGVKAEEAKKFVLANTHRYIPKFAVLNKKNKFSWNWMAFLFPAGWMLSRKMYKGGIIAAMLTIAANCLSYPFSLSLYNLGFEQNGLFAADINSVAEILPQIGAAAIVLALLGAVFDLGIRLFSALLGDYIYKNHSISTIKKIKLNSEDEDEDYRKKGGMSMMLFFLGVLLVQYGYAILIQLL